MGFVATTGSYVHSGGMAGQPAPQRPSRDDQGCPLRGRRGGSDRASWAPGAPEGRAARGPGARPAGAPGSAGTDRDTTWPVGVRTIPCSRQSGAGRPYGRGGRADRGVGRDGARIPTSDARAVGSGGVPVLPGLVLRSVYRCDRAPRATRLGGPGSSLRSGWVVLLLAGPMRVGLD